MCEKGERDARETESLGKPTRPLVRKNAGEKKSEALIRYGYRSSHGEEDTTLTPHSISGSSEQFRSAPSVCRPRSVLLLSPPRPRFTFHPFSYLLARGTPLICTNNRDIRVTRDMTRIAVIPPSVHLETNG